MTILLAILAIIYIVLGIIVYFESQHIGYGLGVSTMMGLLFPSAVIMETALNLLLRIVQISYMTYLKTVLILSGTDYEEYMEKCIKIGV